MTTLPPDDAHAGLHVMRWAWALPEERHRSASVEVTHGAGWAAARIWTAPSVLGSIPSRTGGVRAILGVDGIGTLEMGGTEILLHPRELILVPTDMTVTSRNEGIWARYELRLPRDPLAPQRLLEADPVPLPVTDDSFSVLTSFINAVATRPALGRTAGFGLMEDAASALLVAAAGGSAGSDVGASSAQALRHRANAIIDQRFTEGDLSVAHLAADLQVSERYLRRVFAEEGQSPRTQIELRRLRYAEALLRRSARGEPLGLTEIARRSGFSSTARLNAARRRYPHHP